MAPETADPAAAPVIDMHRVFMLNGGPAAYSVVLDSTAVLPGGLAINDQANVSGWPSGSNDPLPLSCTSCGTPTMLSGAIVGTAVGFALVVVTLMVFGVLLTKPSLTTSWTVNGSTTEGRKMVRDFSKLMLRAYNAEADNCLRTMKPHRLASSIDRWCDGDRNSS